MICQHANISLIKSIHTHIKHAHTHTSRPWWHTHNHTLPWLPQLGGPRSRKDVEGEVGRVRENRLSLAEIDRAYLTLEEADRAHSDLTVSLGPRKALVPHSRLLAPTAHRVSVSPTWPLLYLFPPPITHWLVLHSSPITFILNRVL